MSEAKSIGVINQMYEDRKSGKLGLLVGRDDDTKRVEFSSDNGNFFVSYASFRSNWRKYQIQNAAEPTEKVDEPVEVEDSLEYISKLRNVRIDSSEYGKNMYIDDILVLVTDDDIDYVNATRVFMLPDLFSCSNWGNKYIPESLHYNLSDSNHLTVNLVTELTTPEIFKVIRDAAVTLNLYGYIKNDENESEENN